MFTAYVSPKTQAVSTVDRNVAYTGATSQRMEERYGVVIAVRNVRDQSGGTASLDELRPLRIAIITALLGWAPMADHAPCTFGRGRLLRLANAVLWWQDEFLTDYYLRG